MVDCWDCLLSMLCLLWRYSEKDCFVLEQKDNAFEAFESRKFIFVIQYYWFFLYGQDGQRWPFFIRTFTFSLFFDLFLEINFVLNYLFYRIKKNTLTTTTERNLQNYNNLFGIHNNNNNSRYNHNNMSPRGGGGSTTSPTASPPQLRCNNSSSFVTYERFGNIEEHETDNYAGISPCNSDKRRLSRGGSTNSESSDTNALANAPTTCAPVENHNRRARACSSKSDHNYRYEEFSSKLTLQCPTCNGKGKLTQGLWWNT